MEFHKENGHFNVPRPTSEEENTDEDEGNSIENYEEFRLYKWVQRLDTDYKNYISGKKSKILNENRMQQLAEIGFDFTQTDSKTFSSAEDEIQGCCSVKEEVPDLPWDTRIHQLKSFYDDVGHLKIDHNYRLCTYV